MPKGFEFPPFWATGTELWAPLALGPRASSREGQSLRIFARLAPGVALSAARAEIAAIAARLEKEHPGTNREVTVESLQETVVGEVRPALLVLLAAVVCVLLIACANVAHMLLARSAAREREVAIRSALGAGSRRMIRQLLTESLVLAVLGGAAGILLAAAGMRLLVVARPRRDPAAPGGRPGPSRPGLHPDGRPRHRRRVRPGAGFRRFPAEPDGVAARGRARLDGGPAPRPPAEPPDRFRGRPGARPLRGRGIDDALLRRARIGRSGVRFERRPLARRLGDRDGAGRAAAPRGLLPRSARADPARAGSRFGERDQPPPDRRRHLGLALLDRGTPGSSSRRESQCRLPRPPSRVLRDDGDSDPPRPRRFRERQPRRSGSRRRQPGARASSTGRARTRSASASASTTATGTRAG